MWHGTAHKAPKVGGLQGLDWAHYRSMTRKGHDWVHRVNWCMHACRSWHQVASALTVGVWGGDEPEPDIGPMGVS